VATGTTAAVEFPVPGGYGSLYPTEPRARAMALLNAARSLGKSGLRQFNYDISPDAAPAQNEPPIVGELRSKLSDITERLESALDLIARGETARAIPTINDAELAFKRFASDLLESRNAVAEAVAREQTAAEAAKQATPKPPATAPVQTPAPPLEQTAQQPPAIAQTQAAQAPAAVAEEARKRAEEHAKRIIAEAVEPAKAAVRASVSRAEQSGAEVAKLVDRAANSGLDKARVDAFRMRLEQAQQAVRTLSKAADEATDIGTLGGILDGVSAEMQKLTVLASEIAAASESLTGQKPIEQPTTEVKAGKVAVIRPAIQHSEVQSHVGSNTKAVQVGDAFIGADSAEADNALQHVKQVGALQGRQRTGGEGQEQVIRIVNELHDINGVLGNPETTQYGSPTVNYQAETVEKSEGGKQVGVQSGTLITGRGRFMAIRLAYSRRDEALNKIAKAVAGKQPILADDVYFAGYVPSGYVRLKGEDVYRHESEIESGAEREPIPTQQNEFHWINRYIAGVKALASELGVADKLPRNPTHVRVLSDFKYVEGKEGKEVPIVEFARESDQTKTLRLTAVERRRALWNAMVAANFVSSLEFNEFGSLTQKSILALKQNFGRDLIGDNDKEINESVVGALVYGGLRRAAVMSFYHDRRNEIVASLALELLNNRDFLANIVGRPIGSVDEFTDADITVIADRLAAHSIYLPADTREARDILFDALSRTETREALLARKLSAAEAIDKYVFPVYAKVLSENAESKRMADALTYAAVKLSSVAGTRYDILPVIATLAANTTDENQVSLISKRPEQWVESVLEPKLGDIQAPESGLAPGERNMLQPVARVLVNYLAGKSGGQSKWRNTIDRYVASAKNEVESAGTPTLGGVAEPRTAAEVWDEATKTMSTGDLFTAQPAAPATPATAAAPATPAPGAVAKAVARATRVGETAQAEKPKAPERAREEGSAYDASRPFSAQSLLALAFDSAHAERVPGSTGPFDGSWFKLAAKVAASTFSDSAAAEEALLDVIGSIESQFSDEAGPSEYRKAGKNIEEFVNRWLGTKLIPKERKDAVRAVAIFKSLQNAESILNGELDVKDFRLTAEDVGNFIQIAIGAAALREVAESIAQQREAQVKKYEDNVRDAINAVNTDVIEGGEIPSGPPFGKNPGEYIRTVRRQTEGLREKVSKTPQERALAPEHVEAFLAYLASRAHQDPDAALVYAYFAIGASTGLRQQEIVSIPASAGAGDHGALVLGDKYWSRIKNADTETTEGGIRTRDYVAGAVYNIRVYKQKSGGPSKIEAVHLSNIAADAIQNWMRFRNRLYEDNNPFLFPSRDKGTGKPIDASDLGDIFRSTMERAVEGARRAVQAGQTVPWAALARDVPGYSAPTDFLPGKTRNTAVQYMVKRAGLPQRDAEAVLGHVVDKNAANYVSARNDAPDARKKMALHFKQLQDEVARLLGEVPSASQKPADLNAWGRLVAAIRRGGAFRKDTIDKNRARLLAFAQTLEQSGIKHKSLVSFIVSLAHGANPILLDSIALGLDNYNRINGVAPAVLEGSLIRLSKTATPSDALHEIIHVIHDVFLTDAEREYIKAVWKQALTNVLNSEPADTKVRDAINKFLSDPSGSGITSEQFVDYAKTAGLDSRTIDSLSALYNPFEFFANVMSPAMLAEAIDAKQSNTAVGRLLSAIRDIGVAAIESVLPQKLGDFAEAVFAAIKSNKTDASATEEAAAALSQWNELADRLVSYFDGMRRNVGVRLREPPQELRYASQLSFGSQVFGDLPEGSAPFSAEPAGEGPLTQVFGRIFRVGGAETVDLEKSVRDAQALAAKHGLNIAVANADARVVPPEPGKVTDITENVKRLIADIRASGQENNPVLANLLRRIAVESVLAGENDRGWRIDPNVASQALETGQPLFRTAGSVLRLAHNMFGLPDTDSLRENPFAAVYVALTNIYDAAPVTTQLVSDIVKVMTTKLSDMLTDEQWDALASDPKFSKLVELALEQQRRQYAARLAGGLIDRLARWLAPAGKPPKNHILYEILKNREVLEYVKRVLSQRGYVKMRREAITPSAALAFLASDAGAADREQTLRGLLWQARRIVARSEWIEDQKKRGLTAEQLASLVANYDAATEDPEQRDKYDKDASITPTEAQFQRGLDRPEFKSWYYLFQSPIHITDWSEVLTSRALAEIFTGITPSQTPKVEKVPLPQNEEWRLILAKHGLSKKFSVRDLAKQPDNVFRAVMDAYRRALEEYVSKITGQRPDAIRDTNTFLEIALQNMESKLLVEISRARAEFLKQRLRPDEVAKEISDIKARTKGWVRSLADLLNADMLLSTYFTDSRQGLRRGLQAFVDVMRSILRAKAESSKAAGLEPVDELTEVAQSTVAEKEKWIEEQLAKIKAEPDVASALKEMDGGEQLAFDNAARLALRWAIFERENQIINREINKVDAYLRSHPGDTAAPPVPATIEPGEMDYDELMRFKDAAAEFQKLINTGALLTYAERGGALPDALKKADTVETIDAMLRALAGSQTVQDVLPKVRDVIRQIFTTPPKNLDEAAVRFADAMGLVFEPSGLVPGLQPQEMLRLKKLFARAFMIRWNAALEQARREARAKLGIDGGKPPPLFEGKAGQKLWEKIEAALFAGDFDVDAVNRLIFSQYGAEVKPEDIESLRRLAEEEWNLRQLTPADWDELAQAGVTPAMYELFQRTGDLNVLQLPTDTDERAKFKRYAAIARKEHDVETRHIGRRTHLQNMMVAVWSRMTRPIKPGREHGVARARNLVDAFNELAAANSISTVWFASRLVHDVFFQTFIGGLQSVRAYAKARAHLRWTHLVATGQKPNWVSFQWDYVRFYLQAFHDYFKTLYKSTIWRAFVAALRSIPTGEGVPARVELVETQIHLNDRVLAQINDYVAKGGNKGLAKAMTLAARLIGNFGFTLAQAADVWTMRSFAAPEARLAVRVALREALQGLVPESEILKYEKELAGRLEGETAGLDAAARMALVEQGIKPTKGAIHAAVSAMLYGRAIAAVKSVLAEALANGDAKNALRARAILAQAEAEVANHLATLAWNRSERSVFGEIIRTPMRGAQAIGRFMFIPTGGFTSFSNAMAYSTVQTLMFTPLGFFPGLFKGSPRVASQIGRYRFQTGAIIGTAAGIPLMLLAALPASIGGGPPPDDEREKRLLEAHNAPYGSLGIPIGDGRYLWLSTTVGPGAMLRFWISLGTAARRLFQKQQRYIEQAVEKSLEKGIPFQPQRLSSGDVFGALASAMLDAVLTGQRISSGKIGAGGTDAFSVSTLARGLSAYVPGAPMANSVARVLRATPVDPKANDFVHLAFQFLPGTQGRVRGIGAPPEGENKTSARIGMLTGGTAPPTAVTDKTTAMALANALAVGEPVNEPDRSLYVDLKTGEARRPTESEYATMLRVFPEAARRNIAALGEITERNPATVRAFRQAVAAARQEAVMAAGLMPFSALRGRTGRASGGKGPAVRFAEKTPAPGLSDVLGVAPIGAKSAPSGRLSISGTTPRFGPEAPTSALPPANLSGIRLPQPSQSILLPVSGTRGTRAQPGAGTATIVPPTGTDVAPGGAGAGAGTGTGGTGIRSPSAALMALPAQPQQAGAPAQQRATSRRTPMNWSDVIAQLRSAIFKPAQPFGIVAGATARATSAGRGGGITSQSPGGIRGGAATTSARTSQSRPVRLPRSRLRIGSGSRSRARVATVRLPRLRRVRIRTNPSRLFKLKV
jgi:integrase